MTDSKRNGSGLIIMLGLLTVTITIALSTSSAFTETIESDRSTIRSESKPIASENSHDSIIAKPLSENPTFILDGSIHDPWRPFNERVFAFNRQFDRYLMKPVATGWDKILPNTLRRGIGNAFDNVGMPRRLANNILQLKFEGAGKELARFFLNSTVGIAGFLDVGKKLRIEKSDEDTGQTLGSYGIGPGPYLVLPFMPPLTVRDGFGAIVDVAMNPLIYISFLAGFSGVVRVGTAVNERSLTLKFYQGSKESSGDIYRDVRNQYLRRRQETIQK